MNKPTQKDIDSVNTKLGVYASDVSFSFQLDRDLFEFRTEENKFLLLYMYQQGYAKCLEDIKAIPDFDDYDTLY